MKANVLKSGLKATAGIRGPHFRWLFSLFLALFFLSSCYVEPWYGQNGRPGNTFLSINWTDAKPEYLDAGTTAIPPVFDYGRYYTAWPGFYTFYYDGKFWNGQAQVFYAWEVDYEIWATAGEPGGMYHNGANGPDNYFSIECSPYGPWVYGPGYKTEKIPEGYELKESTEEKIIIEKTDTHFGIRIIYKKVVPRTGTH